MLGTAGGVAMVAMVAMAMAMVVGCGPASEPAGDGDGDGDSRADARPPSAFPDASSQNPSDRSDAAPPEVCDKMDILFVIDNSGSMGEEQDNLAANFPAFIDVLDGFEQELDYRVAVTSTGRDYDFTMDGGTVQYPKSIEGDSGAMLQRCDMTRRWVEADDPDPSATFSCAAKLGIMGPGYEMPLAVIREAFDDRVVDGTNAGFRRDDALLAIVILTDEDDCSFEESVTIPANTNLCRSPDIEPVSTYTSFLDDYTGDRERWALAVIAGETDCTGEFGIASEAARLKDMVGMAGDNGVMSSICASDLAGALAEALDTFDTACDQFPPID